jgi:SAM-dependent methyltransferase
VSETPSHPVVASLLDVVMAPLGEIRARVLPQARGEVLELGAGTGGNFALYPPALRRLAACEPDPHMRRRAARRAERLKLGVELCAASAEALPYPDAAFDTVVATFVLCTIPAPDRALEEARRVLRPGGQLLFAEHVAHRRPAGRRVQDALDRPWGFFAGGCHLNRDAVALIEGAGFGEVIHRAHGSQDWTLAPIVSGRALR